MSGSFSAWPHSPILAPLKLSPHDDKDRQKRPRHRHTPSQLAALNNLYESTEHPPLDLRTDLAERLGMETKTVNAWFQNKRASAKKRSRGGAPYDIPQHSSASSSLVHTPPQPDLDDLQDGDFVRYDNHKQRSSLTGSLHNSRQQSVFHPGIPEHTQFFAESDNIPRKMRVRPTAQQTEALKRFYKTNPHPSKEDREELGDRIGMRYQSITNWFQNQRSLAKKRNEDADSATTTANKKSSVIQSHESRTFSAFPPPSNHPSLSLSLPSNHRSAAPRARRSPTRAPLASPIEALSSRGSTPASVSASNRNMAATFARPRRTRPEPYQLDALKDLFTRTSNPSIEERSALALEIGMDLGKVTNWFRNLRQTARKRAKKGDYDDDDDGNIHSTPISRLGTPSFRSSSSSANEQDDQMELDDGYHYRTSRGHKYGNAPSDMASDDEYQEAVTPSPEPSPPPPSIPVSVPKHHIRVGFHPVVDHGSYTEIDKATAARFSGVKLDDALLLLSFHHHIAHTNTLA